MALCLASLFRLNIPDLASLVTAAFTATIAIATVVYVWVTHKLWKETKRSAEAAMKSADAAVVAADAARISAETSAALHRPFLGLVSHPLENDAMDPVKRFHVELRNFGTIPALRVSGVIEFFLEDRLLAISNEPEAAEIFPGSAYGRILHHRLSDEDLSLHYRGGMNLRLRMRTIYEAPDGRRFEYKAEGPLGEYGSHFLLDKSETRTL